MAISILPNPYTSRGPTAKRRAVLCNGTLHCADETKRSAFRTARLSRLPLELERQHSKWAILRRRGSPECRLRVSVVSKRPVRISAWHPIRGRRRRRPITGSSQIKAVGKPAFDNRRPERRNRICGRCAVSRRPSAFHRTVLLSTVNNRRRITADTALRLSSYFGNSPEFWMNLQTHYDVKIARRNLDAKDIKRIKVNAQLKTARRVSLQLY